MNVQWSLSIINIFDGLHFDPHMQKVKSILLWTSMLLFSVINTKSRSGQECWTPYKRLNSVPVEWLQIPFSHASVMSLYQNTVACSSTLLSCSTLEIQIYNSSLIAVVVYALWLTVELHVFCALNLITH